MSALTFDIFARDHASLVFGKVGNSSAKMGATVGGVFSKLGGQIGGEFGEILAKVGEGFEHVGEHGHNMGQKLMAAGGVIGGLGLALQAAGSGDKQATDQLKAAIEATGGSMADYREEIEKSIKTGEKYGHGAADTSEAIRKLTQATNDPKKAIEEMSVVENLAAAQHVSLSDAAGMLAKVHGGAGKVLKQYGITMENVKAAQSKLTTAQTQHQAAVDRLAHAQKVLSDIELVDHGRKKLTIGQEIQLRNAREAVAAASANLRIKTQNLATAQDNAKRASTAAGTAIDQLGGKLKGQADASVNNFSGKIAVARAKLGDLTAQVGQKLGPALTTAGPLIMGIGAIIESGIVTKGASAAVSMASWTAKTIANTASLVASKAAQFAVAAATKAWAAAQWLINAALDANPIGLIIIGIAALVGGIILAYKHSQTFRNIVDGAFRAVAAAGSFMWNDVLKPVFRFLVNAWFSVAGAIVHGAASAFGWVPGIGPKLQAAAAAFDRFRDTVNNALNGVHDKTVTVTLQARGLTQLTKGAFAGKVIPMAEGGIVKAKPGGTLALLAEAGHDEAVVPLSGPNAPRHAARAARAATGEGSGDIHVHVQGFIVGTAAQVGQALAQTLNTYSRTKGATPVFP